MEKRLTQNEEAMLVFKGSVGLAEGKVSFIKALRWKHACVSEFEEHQGKPGWPEHSEGGKEQEDDLGPLLSYLRTWAFTFTVA